MKSCCCQGRPRKRLGGGEVAARQAALQSRLTSKKAFTVLAGMETLIVKSVLLICNLVRSVYLLTACGVML
jgi:hypothetical protein